jgi:hypothetical protein
MCQEGHLVRTGTKYTLTDAGRRAWEASTPQARRDAVRGREEQRQEEALAAFLHQVESRAGSAFTSPQQKKLLPEVVRAALDRNLVEPGPKSGSFRLRPEGEKWLLARAPADEQIRRLRKGLEELGRRWDAVRQRLEQDAQALASGKLEQVARETHAQGEAALGAYQAALDEVQAFTRLVQAGQELKKALAGTGGQQLQEQLVQETARRESLAAEVRKQLAAHQDEIDAFRRHVEERLTALGARLAEPSPGPARPSPPPEPVAWETTRQAIEDLRRQALRTGGIVKVPELIDAVLSRLPGLEIDQLRRWLLRWQDEDRLVLQVCNDPRLEPRSAEGIASPLGLLFYVQVR